MARDLRSVAIGAKIELAVRSSFADHARLPTGSMPCAARCRNTRLDFAQAVYVSGFGRAATP